MVGHEDAAVSAAIGIGCKRGHVSALEDKALHGVGLVAQVVVFACGIAGGITAVEFAAV